jgi:hypothetical protein
LYLRKDQYVELVFLGLAKFADAEQKGIDDDSRGGFVLWTASVMAEMTVKDD